LDGRDSKYSRESKDGRESNCDMLSKDGRKSKDGSESNRFRTVLYTDVLGNARHDRCNTGSA
jgi:hypothetical protein